MPKIPSKVNCPNCHRTQPDEGRGKTCSECGFSPLPSFSYPIGHAFRPKPRPTSDAVVINRLIRSRKK